MRYILFLLILLPCAHAEEFMAEQITVFSSPMGALPELTNFIASADTSLYVNGYTFTSEEIAAALLRELQEGTHVVLMVDRVPVGGMPERERILLSTLAAQGAEVYLYDGSLRFNHGKYVIADNTSVLITTENFGNSGFPVEGTGNRGWGAVIFSDELSRFLAGIFFFDLKQSVRYEDRRDMLIAAREAEHRSTGRSFRGNFPVVAVVAPDNAIDATLSLLRSANRSLYVEQFYIYTYWGRAKEGSPERTPNLFLEEVINAARRGVEVRILLDSTWYNLKKGDPRSNLRTARYVNEIAQRENLNLEARLARPGDGINKYHLKGVVVDGRAVMLGSMNWNEHSPKKNREVNVIIYGEPARYFEKLFLEDWKRSGGTEGKLRREVAVLLAVVLLVLALRLRRGR
ncbi:phospholipase D-like domain-containing protein [Candidatus Pyrohabitans sp.]